MNCQLFSMGAGKTGTAFRWIPRSINRKTVQAREHNMRYSSNMIRFLYGTKLGRLLLKLIMQLRMDRAVVRFLRSGWSRPLIGWVIRRNSLEISREEQRSYRSFREFFARTRPSSGIDITPGHLISPCDGWMSAFPIDLHSSFFIKNSHYRLCDLLQDENLAERYIHGTCLIFRLSTFDYHHYCYIDSGIQGKNHFIPGVLHSVQPIACEKVPVFVQNRRSWCLLTTEHFGSVVQCEIGALIVGGIYNEKECARFSMGTEKGHFELAGSTIVLLFERGQMELLPTFREALSQTEEVRVHQGEWIGISVPRKNDL